MSNECLSHLHRRCAPFRFRLKVSRFLSLGAHSQIPRQPRLLGPPSYDALVLILRFNVKLEAQLLDEQTALGVEKPWISIPERNKYLGCLSGAFVPLVSSWRASSSALLALSFLNCLLL